jgi:hypothetical protein
VENAYKPKIYNSRSDQLILNNSLGCNKFDLSSITKINYPLLVDKYKIVVSSNSSSSSDYKGMGLLEIVFTPFDNIIKFIIAKEINENGDAVAYNLSDILIMSFLRTINFVNIG